MNSSGQVVGQFGSRAFLYSGGVIIDLNDLIVDSAGLYLTSALAINNNGQIVAQGIVDFRYHTFLLDPFTPSNPGSADTPEPSTLLLIGGGLIGLRFRRHPNR